MKLVINETEEIMAKNNNLITQLSEATVIKGDIEVNNDLRVAGTVEGNIKCTAQLVILDGAKIIGSIETESININGYIKGNVACKGQSVLESRAQLEGDLTTHQLIINEGALFHGSCNMSKPHKSSEVNL